MRIDESQLRRIIREEVQEVLNEFKISKSDLRDREKKAEIFKHIARRGHPKRIAGLTVDQRTAEAVLTLLDRMSSRQRRKFLAKPLQRIIIVATEVVL